MAPLKGIRIVDLTRGRTGRLAVTHLVDQGARAIRVNGPPDVEPMDAILARGRPSATVPASRWKRWVRGCDVVVDDGVLDAEDWPVHALLDACPGVVVLQITGPGPVPSESAAAALAGVHSAPLKRRPQRAPWATVEVVGSLLGATGVVSALIARRRDGRGQRVGVDLVAAALQVHELTALLTDRAPAEWRPVQWAASPFVAGYVCRRGQLFIHLGLPHHLDRFLTQVAAVHSPEGAARLAAALSAATRADPSSVPKTREARALVRALDAVFAERDAGEWERLMSEAGLCAVRIRTLAEWRESEAANAGEHVQSVPDPQWGDVMQPGPCATLPQTPPVAARSEGTVRWRSRTVRASAPDDRAPLAGTRVLDLTQVIAGPVAARGLAELGAAVLRVENPRLEVGWVPAFHRAFNAGKASVLLDLTPERLTRLLVHHQPDVVVHNWRGAAARRMGLTCEALHEHCPGAVLVELSAYGNRGPWATRPGWEQTAQAVAGVQWEAGRGTPELHAQPIHDLCTGLAGTYGALLALWAGAPMVHTSLARLATWLQVRTLPRVSGAYAPSELAVGEVDAQGHGFVRRGRHWWWTEPGVGVPWRSVRGALADQRRLTHRERGAFAESVTRIRPALTLARTPLVELAPAAVRGAEGSQLGIDGLEPDSPSADASMANGPNRRLARLKWMASLVRWGGQVVWSRQRQTPKPTRD